MVIEAHVLPLFPYNILDNKGLDWNLNAILM